MKVSPDLSIADVYVTIMGRPGQQTAALNALRHSAGLMRTKLTKALTLHGHTVAFEVQNADAIEEMIKKHGTQIRRTPPEILLASLKAWDEVAAENSAKNPTFKRVYESQREYAAKVVPAKRYMFPPYSFAANYYWPQEGAPAADKKAAAKKP